MYALQAVINFFQDYWPHMLGTAGVLAFGQLCLWYYTKFRWKHFFTWLQLPKELKALANQKVYQLKHTFAFEPATTRPDNKDFMEDRGQGDMEGCFWRYIHTPGPLLSALPIRKIDGPRGQVHYGRIRGEYLRGFRRFLDELENFASHWQDLEQGRTSAIHSTLFRHQPLSLLRRFPLTPVQITVLSQKTGRVEWNSIASPLLRNEARRLLIEYGEPGVDWKGEEYLRFWEEMTEEDRQKVLENISEDFLSSPKVRDRFWMQFNTLRLQDPAYFSPVLCDWLASHPQLIYPQIWHKIDLKVIQGIWAELPPEEKKDSIHQKAFWQVCQTHPFGFDLPQQVESWPQLLSMKHFDILPQGMRIPALHYAQSHPEEAEHSRSLWNFLAREVKQDPNGFDDYLVWLRTHPEFIDDSYLRMSFWYENYYLAPKVFPLLRLRPNEQNLRFLEGVHAGPSLKEFMGEYRELVQAIQGGLSLDAGEGGQISAAAEGRDA